MRFPDTALEACLFSGSPSRRDDAPRRASWHRRATHSPLSQSRPTVLSSGAQSLSAVAQGVVLPSPSGYQRYQAGTRSLAGSFAWCGAGIAGVARMNLPE